MEEAGLAPGGGVGAAEWLALPGGGVGAGMGEPEGPREVRATSPTCGISKGMAGGLSVWRVES